MFSLSLSTEYALVGETEWKGYKNGRGNGKFEKECREPTGNLTTGTIRINSGCRMRVVQPPPTPVTSTATAAATMSENMKINYSSSWDSGEMAAEIYWCSTVWNNNNRCSTVWNNSNNNRQSGYRMMFVGSIVILSTCWHIYQIYYVMWYFIESVPFITATCSIQHIIGDRI